MQISSLVTSLPICSTSTYPLQQLTSSSHSRLPESMAMFLMLLSSQCFILSCSHDNMGCWITYCSSWAPAARGSDSAFLKDLVYMSQKEKSDKAMKRENMHLKYKMTQKENKCLYQCLLQFCHTSLMMALLGVTERKKPIALQHLPAKFLSLIPPPPVHSSQKNCQLEGILLLLTGRQCCFLSPSPTPLHLSPGFSPVVKFDKVKLPCFCT